MAFFSGGLFGQPVAAMNNPTKYGTQQQNGALMNKGISNMGGSFGTMWNNGLGKGLKQLGSGIQDTARGAGGALWNAAGRNLRGYVLDKKQKLGNVMNAGLKAGTAVLDGANRVARAGYDVGLEQAKGLNKVVNTGLRGATAA